MRSKFGDSLNKWVYVIDVRTDTWLSVLKTRLSDRKSWTSSNSVRFRGGWGMWGRYFWIAVLSWVLVFKDYTLALQTILCLGYLSQLYSYCSTYVLNCLLAYEYIYECMSLIETKLQMVALNCFGLCDCFRCWSVVHPVEWK